MSDWTGPGLYRIESATKRSARVSLSGGGKADGTSAIMWNDDPNFNDIFAFTLLGIGNSGKNEYHIINYNSGTFLSCEKGAPNGSKLTGNTLGPADSRVRWNVIPLRNGTGQYWISPVVDSKMYLNVHATSTDNGAIIGIYNEANHQSTKWYLQHTQDPEFFDFPNVGRAK